MHYSFQTYQSPIGILYLVGTSNELTVLAFEKNWPRFKAQFPKLVEEETTFLNSVKFQLTEYFAGSRRTFDIDVELRGSEFESKVWNALREIPYGTVRTYGEQAVRIGSPLAARAVGRADGRNAVSIVIPCHRVVSSKKTLTGYAGGLEAKRYLLELETGQKFFG